MAKPNVMRQWKTEESSVSGQDVWVVLVQAARFDNEEILGWGWIPMHDSDGPTSVVSFHRKAATVLLRSLYSAFAALNNPDDYLVQVDLGWTLGGQSPTSGVVGSSQDHGSVQIYADWSGSLRYSTFMIYPLDGQRICVVLGIESVGHLIQITTQAFDTLDWPIPP